MNEIQFNFNMFLKFFFILFLPTDIAQMQCCIPLAGQIML